MSPSPLDRGDTREEREMIQDALAADVARQERVAQAATAVPAAWDPAVVAALLDLIAHVKDRIAICGHGTIFVTCGPCMASWLQR